MCWDAQAQRQNCSASPLCDTAVPQSLREILFKWVPHCRKWSQGHSVFTSGVPNMSGTRLTCKKFDLRRHVFQVGPPSLLLVLMAQTTLEEFQLSAPSPHDVVDTCRLHGRGPRGGLHQVQLKSGWAATQSVSPFRVLLLLLTSVRPHTSPYKPVRARMLAAFFLQRCSLEVGPLAVSG